MDAEGREKFEVELNAPLGGRNPAKPTELELQQEATGFLALQQMMASGG